MSKNLSRRGAGWNLKDLENTIFDEINNISLYNYKPTIYQSMLTENMDHCNHKDKQACHRGYRGE